MKSSPFFVLLAAGLVTLGGCVAQNELDQYRNQYKVQEETILDLQAQLEDKNRQIEILRNAKNPNADLSAQLADALADKTSLEAALAKAKDQLTRAGTTPIPVELADELEELAKANPDLMSYDADTGAIRFRSDVTFGTGRADVRESAVPIIGKLAGVLNSPSATQYEVRVVGHTDNVPMRNAANIQRFGDNWGLSTARAVSVMKAFRNAGISESRMSVGGHGEFRPVEENGPKGSEANRRVEIYLVPMSKGAESSGGAPAAASTGEIGSGRVVPAETSFGPSTQDAGK